MTVAGFYCLIFASAVQKLLVVLVDHRCHVRHAAIADLDVVAVTYFSQPVSAGKRLSNNFKKVRPMFVVACSLNGG